MPKDVLGRPVVTAAEMDAMTPEQRRDLVRSRFVWDLTDLPDDVAAEIRAKGQALVADLERSGGERSVLVRASSVDAGLARDGAVELLTLEIDISWPHDPDDEDAPGNDH